MILDEKEAKTKWCPFAVASHTDPRQGFREDDQGKPKTFPCLGSGCAVWQQESIYRRDSGQFEPTGRGWCGLARRA